MGLINEVWRLEDGIQMRAERKTPNSGAKDFKLLYFLFTGCYIFKLELRGNGHVVLREGTKKKKKKIHGTSSAVTLASALYPEATCFEKRSVSVAQLCRRPGSEE